MARLIHLNGPPGIGKSTLAARYVGDHPGVLNLDIDQLRGMVGGWQDRFAETGEIVRPLAQNMAATHLRGGRDVIMPQFLGSLSEVERFEAVVRAAGAEFCEVFLMDTKERSVARFSRRGEDGGLPWHRYVQEVVGRKGGDAYLAAMYDRLTGVLAARPGAIVIPSTAGAVSETYQSLTMALHPPDGEPQRLVR